MAKQSRGAEIRPYKLYKGSKTSAEEFVVETDGLSFGIIFGDCDAGHYIAIPEFGVCVPAAKPEDGFYNYERLCGCNNQFVRDNAKTLDYILVRYGDDTSTMKKRKCYAPLVVELVDDDTEEKHYGVM